MLKKLLILMMILIPYQLFASEYDMSCQETYLSDNSKIFRCENSDVVCYVARGNIHANSKPNPSIFCKFKE